MPKASGLTMSRMYHNSWLFPVRVHVCQIDRINDEQWHRLTLRFPRLFLNPVISDVLPHRAYRLKVGDPDPPWLRTALQLPYRVILTSIDGQRREVWFFEDEAEFTRFSKAFVTARQHNHDILVQNSIIDQEPV